MPKYLGTKRAWVNFVIDAPTEDAALLWLIHHTEPEDILVCRNALDREGYADFDNNTVEDFDEDADEPVDVTVGLDGEPLLYNPSQWTDRRSLP